MNLPNPVASLVEAQNNFDHNAYANCFNEEATVYDEGETHTGRSEIKEWIRKANEKYKSRMVPIDFTADGSVAVLRAEVSGTFPGSPIVLSYYFDLPGDSIQALTIKG